MNGVWRTLSIALTANTAGFISGMSRAGSATKVFGAVVAVSLALALGQAIQFESAMAGVAKTVDANAREMAVLERGIVSMANRMPATREEIAGVAEAAGQLGISKGALLDFTEVAVQLGVTTNLAADDAATGLAKIANVMGTSEGDFDRMGATLVELGNNGASTESDILSMAQRLSGIGSLIGASEADVLGLANAMSSVGIEAELGGGATQRMFLKIDQAVQDGGTALTGFATTSGMSAEAFAAAWEKDPVRAYESLLQGLDKIEESGGNVSATLDALGIKGTQNRQVILRLIGAHELLGESLDDAERAWMENTALTEEAEKRYATAESQLKIFRNQVTYVGAALGAEMIPGLLGAIDGARDLGSWFKEMGERHGPRLLGVWHDLASVGDNLASVLGVAYDSAQPLAATLVAISAVGLAGLIDGLDSVTGFLERNEWLTRSIAAATAAWASMQAWGLLLSTLGPIATTLKGIRTAIMGIAATRGVSNLAATWGVMGASAGGAARGVTNLLSTVASSPTAMAGAAIGVGVFLVALDELVIGARKAEENADALTGAMEATGTSLRRAFDAKLAKTIADVAGGFDIGDSGNAFRQTIDGMGTSASELAAALNGTDEQFGAFKDRVADFLVGRGQETLIGPLNEDLDTLRGSSQRAAEQQRDLAEANRELGIETDGATDAAADGADAADKGTAAQRALADATGQTIEEVMAADEAWVELADSMRETWASAFDLGSKFSGRMTIRERDFGLAELRAGVEDQVAGIRDSLADASREISEGLDDTLADISESLADTDEDVGKGLAKSLAGIDEDLAETVADIQEEMAAARFEMSGQDLADALSEGQKRIADATEDAADRKAEAEESAEERRAAAVEEASEREADAIEDARKREAEAVEEAEARKAEAWAASDKSLTDYVDQNGVTGQQIADFYAGQTIKVTEFASNINKAFALGYDPSLISDLLVQGPDEAAGTVEALVRDYSAGLVDQVNEGVTAMQTLSDEAVEIARLANLATGDMSDDMARNLDKASEIGRWKATLGTRATAEAIAKEMKIGADVVKMIAAAYQINLVDSVNPILEALGQPRIVGRGSVGVGTPGGGQMFNTGGRVPGSGPNVDSVLAWVTPGEHVITQPKAKEWGHGFFDDINSGRLSPADVMAAGYNEGGEVLLAAGRRLEQAGAHITEHPVWDRVDPVHVQGSHHYRNTSGTGADAFDANYGAGTSAREMAFFDQWAPVIAAMGLRVLWRVAGHYNHLHADLGGPGYGMGGSGNYSGGGAGPVGHYAPFPAPPEIGDGMLADVAEITLKKTHDIATWWAASQFSPFAVAPGNTGAGGSPSAVRAMVEGMAAARGWVGPEWSALDRLVQKESSWNPNAQNPTSTAYGLFQFLNSTWGPYGPKTSDPRLQAQYGFGYISDRYGSPSAALAFHLGHNWYNQGGPVLPYGSYDGGGYLPTGLSLAYNGTGRPEPAGHHLTPADRIAQVNASVTVINQVHVGNRYLGEFVNEGAEAVVDADHRRGARLARAGQRHG